MKKKAFTLIELLVVITIIALLVTILMPALTRAKEQAKITLCSSNLKQQGLGIIMYANANGGQVPTYKGTGDWMWDLSYETTRAINKAAGIKSNEIYVCPSNSEKEYNDRRWWQYSQFAQNPDKSPLDDEDAMDKGTRISRYRAMPYIYFFYRGELQKLSSGLKDGSPSGENVTWVSNMEKMKTPGEKPMVLDTIISWGDDPEDAQFFDLTSTDINPYYKDNSNHKSRKRNAKGLVPSGGNHLYVDGHVSWILFSDINKDVTTGKVMSLAHGPDSGLDYWWKYR